MGKTNFGDPHRAINQVLATFLLKNTALKDVFAFLNVFYEAI